MCEELFVSEANQWHQSIRSREMPLQGWVPRPIITLYFRLFKDAQLDRNHKVIWLV
jgi:hypothetical protein